MSIKKMQSQTTTHHVCGGGFLRQTEIRGLSWPFAGLLGARCSPLRNGGPRGGRAALMRGGVPPALPYGLGWPRCPGRSRSRCHRAPSRAPFWRVIHKNREGIIG
jgi:hypothetical protein